MTLKAAVLQNTAAFLWLLVSEGKVNESKACELTRVKFMRGRAVSYKRSD